MPNLNNLPSLNNPGTNAGSNPGIPTQGEALPLEAPETALPEGLRDLDATSVAGSEAPDGPLPTNPTEIALPDEAAPPTLGTSPSDGPLEFSPPEAVEVTVPPVTGGAEPITEVAPPVGWEGDNVATFSPESEYLYCITTFANNSYWKDRCLANSLSDEDRKNLDQLANEIGDPDLTDDEKLGRILRYQIARDYGVGSEEEWAIAVINNISQDRSRMSPEARLDLLQKIQYLYTRGQEGMDAVIDIARIAASSRAGDGDPKLDAADKLLWAATVYATASIAEQFQMDEFIPPEFAQFGPMDEDLLTLLEAGTWIVDGSGLILDFSSIGMDITNEISGISGVKGITAFEYAGVIFLIVNGSIDMVTSVSKYDNPDDKWMAVAHSSGRFGVAATVAAGGAAVALIPACVASVVCGVVVVAGTAAVGYGADWWVRQDEIFGKDWAAPGWNH